MLNCLILSKDSYLHFFSRRHDCRLSNSTVSNNVVKNFHLLVRSRTSRKRFRSILGKHFVGKR
jgi:hypothetical protein